MSRVGKKIIEIPAKTEVALQEGNTVVVKGPLGELKRSFRPEISIVIEDNKISFKPKNEKILTKALWGTTASHVLNMIEGVNKPFTKELSVEGIGFKSEVKGDKLVMSLGFSHPVEMQIPQGIEAKAEKNNITISGIDKELVGQFASKIRSSKKPEPYKGKGIRYVGEVVRQKAGKKTT